MLTPASVEVNGQQAFALDKHSSRSTLLRSVAAEPQTLEPGLTLLDQELCLCPEVSVDLLFGDAHKRPVAFLATEVAGAREEEQSLGRAFRALAALRDQHALLGRVYPSRSVSFAARPRVLLASERFSDTLWRAASFLSELCVELVEIVVLEVEGRWVVRRLDRARAGVLHPFAAAELPASAGAPGKISTTVAAGESRPSAVRPSLVPANTENPDPVTGAVAILDEAKRKILRISDDIEEQVDGDIVRFLWHDRVLAVLATGSDLLGLYIGDQPERRRPLSSLVDLDRALDDVFRRYFTLIRQTTRNAP